MKSEITKKYSALSIVFFWASIICVCTPLIVYTVIGFINGETTEKVSLGLCFSVAAILTVINLVFKYHIRSALWILVLGIYMCLDNIQVLLVLVACTTILDEFVFTPLHKNFKNKATINREIDKRVP